MRALSRATHHGYTSQLTLALRTYEGERDHGLLWRRDARQLARRGGGRAARVQARHAAGHLQRHVGDQHGELRAAPVLSPRAAGRAAAQCDIAALGGRRRRRRGYGWPGEDVHIAVGTGAVGHLVMVGQVRRHRLW